MASTRSSLARLAFALAIPLAMAQAPASCEDPAPAEQTTVQATPWQLEVLQLTNQERAKAGCGPLRLNDQLNASAMAHSRDMQARDYFDHTSPEGTTPGDRARAAGFNGVAWGENIGKGYPSPSAVVNGWMNSPGHRRGILTCSFTDLGVGHAGTSWPIYWTQQFGTPSR